MAIFHSFLYVYRRVNTIGHGSFFSTPKLDLPVGLQVALEAAYLADVLCRMPQIRAGLPATVPAREATDGMGW